MDKLKIEFIGTFFLVLVVAFTGQPIAVGAVLIGLVYMGGYISGAHYNPAVTASQLITGKISMPDAVKYILVQFLGGLLAAFVYNVISTENFHPQVPETIDLSSAFLVEVLFTFLLCSVIFHVASTAKTKGNTYYGAAIGFTLMAIAFVGGPISSGIYNPAVGLSPLLFDYKELNASLVDMSIYFFGPMTGGLLAGLFYRTFDTKK